MADMTIISSEEFYELKTLSKQLRICSESETAHLACVLEVNKIGRSCIEISTLLDTFFSRFSNSPPEVSSILTELVESSENAIGNHLKSTDHLDALCQWTIILKVFNESLQHYPTMWNVSKSPKEIREKLEEEIKKRDEKDSIRKVLMEAPELQGFLKTKSVEEEFTESIDKAIASNCIEVIEKSMRTIPEGHKFTDLIFEKLFKLEHDFSLKGGLTQAFYNCLFFAYENAENQKSICQKYANLEGRYSKDFKKMRNNASSGAYIAFYSKFVSTLIKEQKKTDKITHMLHWLYVMRPGALTSVIAEHKGLFKPLPTIPSNEAPLPKVQEDRKVHRPSVTFDLTKKPPQNPHILNGPIESIRSAGGEKSEVPSTRKKQEIEKCGDTFKQFVKKTEQSGSPKVLPSETVNNNVPSGVSSDFGVSDTVIISPFSRLSTLRSGENTTIGSSHFSPRGGYQQPRGMELKSSRRGVSVRYQPSVRDFSKYGSGISEKSNGADGTPTGDKSL